MLLQMLGGERLGSLESVRPAGESLVAQARQLPA
jgi:hypothetical protein